MKVFQDECYNVPQDSGFDTPNTLSRAGLFLKNDKH